MSNIAKTNFGLSFLAALVIAALVAFSQPKQAETAADGAFCPTQAGYQATYGLYEGQEGYDSNYDFTGDGVVNIRDTNGFRAAYNACH